METKFIERGRYLGNIDIPGSLDTMSVGEVWHINPTLVNLRTVRNACSMANSCTDRVFAVNCPGFTEPCIKVTRIH